MQIFKYVNEYIQYKNFKSPSTKRLYILSLKLFNNYLNENNLEIDFNDMHISSLITNFQISIKDKYSKASITSFVKVILNYFNYLDLQGYITDFHNNIEAIDDNQISKNSIISIEEINTIVEYLKNSEDYINLFMVYIAFYTGLKVKYLCKIKYSDFILDENNKFCYINKIMRISPFKIILPTEVYEIYQILCDLNARNEINNAYILINKKGNIYTERYIRSIFSDICKNAKVNHYTASSFRHSAVYYYIKKNGCDKVELAMAFNWTKDNYDRMYKNLFLEIQEKNK